MTPRPGGVSWISHAVWEVLMSADDLSRSDALADEHGFPDPDLILAAAVELVARKPHLAGPRGDVGQGRRGDVPGGVAATTTRRIAACGRSRLRGRRPCRCRLESSHLAT